MPLPGQRLYANCIWIGPANADNFMQGRAGYAVVGIVDHHSASSLQGLIYRFENPPAVSGGGASAHFAIDREEETRDGLLGFGQYAIRYQLVDTADMAFADSNYFENLTTNAIEHVRQWSSGPGTPGYEPITDAQYRSSTELHMILSQDQGWPLDLEHVTPHNFYSQTTCPGDLDLARIIQGGGDLPLTQADVDLVVNALNTDSATNLIPARLNGVYQKTYNNGSGTNEFETLKAMIASLKTPTVDNTAVLAAIADLKAHPDPTAAAIATRIENALKGA